MRRIGCGVRNCPIVVLIFDATVRVGSIMFAAERDRLLSRRDCGVAADDGGGWFSFFGLVGVPRKAGIDIFEVKRDIEDKAVFSSLLRLVRSRALPQALPRFVGVRVP